MSARNQHAITVLYQAYTAPVVAIFRFPAPVTGQIIRVLIVSDSGPTGGDATFDVNIAGTSIWDADPTQRVKIADGDGSGEKTGLTAAITKDDEITVDFDSFSGSAASVGNSLTIVIEMTETGATATDAELRDRATHTGSQLAATISDFDTAVDSRVNSRIAALDVLTYKGAIDCSTNPNYPAADAGDSYRVSVAGKIGGASGLTVEAGDILICHTDSTSAGTQAAVGASWDVIQANIVSAIVSGTSAGGALSGTYPNPDLAAGVAGDGLSLLANVLAVNVDNSTLEINSDALRIKDGGVTAAKLATSGVSATTYGDATHVPQITVNSKGQITAASDVAITASSRPYPYTVPGSPGNIDDEFDSSSLNGAWTLTATSGLTYDINTTVPSCLCVRPGGNKDLSIVRAFTPGASAFGLTCCFHASITSAQQNFNMQLLTSGDVNIVRWVLYSNASNALTHYADYNSAFTQAANVAAQPTTLRGGTFFLHLESDGANGFVFWFSWDGIGWHAVGNINATGTIAKLKISLTQNGATVNARHCLDFVRRDWVRLP